MGEFRITTTMNGLQTFTTDVPDTAQYTVNVTNTIPIAQSGNTGSGAGSQPFQSSTAALVSSLVTTIKHAGSTVYTSETGGRGAFVVISATAGDSIQVITSSASANDSANNAVQSTISISEGSV